MLLRAAVLQLTLVLAALSSQSQPLHDGRLFDQGRALTERSPRAPEALDELQRLIGQWDVEITTYPTDSTSHTTSGQAEISLMNRGWSYMERIRVDDVDGSGNANHIIAFLTFNPSTERFELGVASSYSEQISLYDGNSENGHLELRSAVRRLGGGTVTHLRISYSFPSRGAMSVVLENSDDHGNTWQPTERREYSRRADSASFMTVRDDYGTAASSRPEEARQFDFLLGEWTANHNILLGGNWVQYPSTTTAVFIIGGHAILEHSWFSVDPSHPEAATSIVRLYNRAERRWESLYLNNRSNGLLHFGGVWESDRLVLHGFNTNLTDTISRWVFHDIQLNRYQWFAESSADRGRTFRETWTINVVRK